jgi:thiamine monophosphate synthase
LNEKVANAFAGLSGASTIGGFTLAQINEVLQAGAFIVAIISGLAATFYYLKKSK